MNLHPERYASWARRTWNQWTPSQRAEFAGALQSLQDLIRGAADAKPARKRQRDKGPH